MTTSTAQLVALLADSLAVWRIEGEVLTDDQSGGAAIRTRPGFTLWVERAVPSQRPVRWWLRWQEDAGTDQATVRRLPCASVVSMLRAARGRLEASSSAT